VVWAREPAEKKIDDAMKQWGEGGLNYFFNQYQVAAGDEGAARTGYLSNDVDDDFQRLAKGYTDSVRTLLLVGVQPDDINNAMDMAKIIWKAAREQFKYTLAMNDILYKAELQLKNSKNQKDKNAYAGLTTKVPSIQFRSSGEEEFQLSPSEFWRLFTAPSLKAMLHYSVNSYTNEKMVIPNPLSDAIFAEKEKVAEEESSAAKEE
jgi:hypothetical protein